jgi:hypothetical protein
MASQYSYMCFKTTWGIYVGMTAEMLPYNGFEGAASEAANGIYLYTERVSVSDLERDYLHLGIQLVEKQVREKLSERLPVVIRILAFDIAHNDYDPEGMVYVMAGWLAQEAGSDYRLADPVFDKAANRYIFDFPEPPK